MHYTIFSWMKDKFNLSGCNRDVFAYLYGFGMDAHPFLIDIECISEATGHSNDNVIDSLDYLRRNLFFVPNNYTEQTMEFIVSGDPTGNPDVKFAGWVFEKISGE